MGMWMELGVGIGGRAKSEIARFLALIFRSGKTIQERNRPCCRLLGRLAGRSIGRSVIREIHITRK